MLYHCNALAWCCTSFANSGFLLFQKDSRDRLKPGGLPGVDRGRGLDGAEESGISRVATTYQLGLPLGLRRCPPDG